MAAVPRSLQWRIDLGQLPRLSSGPANDEKDSRASETSKEYTDRKDQWRQRLDRQRETYAREKEWCLRAPDGSLTQHATRSLQPDLKEHDAGPSVDPLNLADDNPWHAHFAKLTVIDQIRIDVQRVLADEERFERAKARHASAQGVSRAQDSFEDQLTSVLAVWSLAPQNEDVGYRQGMHELAAVCWLVLVEDIHSANASGIGDLLGPRHLESDTHSLFELIMDRAKVWYAWKDPSQKQLPILQRCGVVRDSLMAYDVDLGMHLDRLHIATQLFAIRWIRLLFTRELTLEDAIELWDHLFHCDPSLDLVDHVCVAMLARIEGQILAGNNSEVLRLVLSYPRDAVASGESVRMLIDEANQVRRRYQAVRSGNEPVGPGAWTTSSSHSFTQSPSLAAAPTMLDLARGSYAQSVGASFNRALYNVQKTVQQAYQQAQQQRLDSSNGNFPPAVDGLAQTKKGRVDDTSLSNKSDQERLRHLEQSNRAMGDAIKDIVTVLEKQQSERFKSPSQGDGDVSRNGPDERTKEQESELLLSLTALKHIGDVLSGVAPEFEAEAVGVAKGKAREASLQDEAVRLASPITRQEKRADHTNDVASPAEKSSTAGSFAKRFQLATTSPLERAPQSLEASFGRPSPNAMAPIASGQREIAGELSLPATVNKERKQVSDRLREASKSHDIGAAERRSAMQIESRTPIDRARHEGHSPTGQDATAKAGDPLGVGLP